MLESWSVGSLAECYSKCDDYWSGGCISIDFFPELSFQLDLNCFLYRTECVLGSGAQPGFHHARSALTDVSGLQFVQGSSVSQSSVFAVKTDGSVWAWGHNSGGPDGSVEDFER